MKLMFEEAYELDHTIEEDINESTGKSNKKYVIKGVFTTMGEKNRNGRIYPAKLWEREVKAYKTELANNTIQTLMEWEHPARSSIDMMESVAKIRKIDIVGNKIMGEAVLLDNPKANQLKTLIDNGVKIGVSSRGLGRVQEGIVKEYKLLTWDCVSAPSDYNANLNGMVESYQLNEGVLEDKEYEILESGEIKEVEMCTKNTCQKYDKKVVQEALAKKVKELFEHL
jgi:hypothetical protein